MFVDSKECRLHALECVRHAQAAASPKARKTFAELAKAWLRLAVDFEQMQALEEWTEPEPEKRIG